MINYGTWCTFDVPIKKQDEAYNFLFDEFKKIGGFVREVMNPHDFGSYPSFEIDTPESIATIYDTPEDERNEEEDEAYKNWVDKAGEVEWLYYKKFDDYL